MDAAMNIIYIHTHDSGRILSPYGYATPTPNLFSFCSDALLFRQAYSVAPTCSPSRAGLLTGMYPHSNGMLGLAQRGFSLKDYSLHLVSFLKKLGYQTALCGIQHEAGSYLRPEDGAALIGYDENLSTPPSPYKEEELYLWDKKNAQSAARWLKGYKKDKPFFLSFGFFSTHRKFPEVQKDGISSDFLMPPYPTPDTPETRQDYAGYLSSAQYFDESLGELLRALKESGLYEKSLIFFTTDHGIPMPYAKGCMFDSGLGVSLAMRVPQGLRGVSDRLVSHVDVFPTICDLIGAEKSSRLQGLSFASAFSGEPCAEREEIFAEFNFHTSYEPMRCVRTKRYKYIRCYDASHLQSNPSNTDNSTVKDIYLRAGFATRAKDPEAIFDLLYDPGERKNEIDNPSYAGVISEMRARLLRHQRATGDPILNGPIPLEPQWKVNRSQCINPSSKNPDDYL